MGDTCCEIQFDKYVIPSAWKEDEIHKKVEAFKCNVLQPCWNPVRSQARQEHEAHCAMPSSDLFEVCRCNCSSDVRESLSHLLTKGFTAAPHSEKLITALQAMSRQELNLICESTMLPALYSADVIQESLSQLRNTLPTQYSVLGPYKARYRNAQASAAMLHKDLVQLTQADVRNSLFPMVDPTSVLPCGYEKRYQVWKDELSAKYCRLKLPVPPSCSSLVNNDLTDFTLDIIGAIQAYNNAQTSPGDELVFEVINVWIPRDIKRLVFFPLDVSMDIKYPLGDEAIKKVKAAANSVQSFSGGNALFFFGRSVLHQAFIFPGSYLEDGSLEVNARHLESSLGDGSLEGRYLLLVQRARAHPGCQPVLISGIGPSECRLPGTNKDPEPRVYQGSALADVEVAAQIEGEIIRHGGKMNCNLVYQSNPKLRKLVGDRRLLEFMRKYPDLFLLEKSERGADFVRTAHTVQSEGLTSGATLPCNATFLGLHAILELEHAVTRMLFKWKDGKFGNDSPFFRQVMRDHHVRQKLQSFIKHCPLKSLMRHKGPDASDEAGETWWVAQNLHLKAFLQDRPTLFTVFDSGEDCTKGWDLCCCHLKIQLEDGVPVPPPRENKEDSKKNKKAARMSHQQQVEQKRTREEQTCQGTHAGKCQQHKFTKMCASEEEVVLTIALHRDDLVVVDKPPNTSSETVFDMLQKEANKENEGRQIMSVSLESHQDKDISGCLVVPRNETSASFLMGEFSEQKVTKVYRALVHGRTPPEGKINAKLFMAEQFSKYRAFVSPKGKPCVTRFKTLAVYQRIPSELYEIRHSVRKYYQSDPWAYVSYVECYPRLGQATCAKTVSGGNHQIRAHFQHIGHHLVGDARYGSRDLDWCPRLFLHCYSISGSGLSGVYQAEAPLPSDLEAVLTDLDERAIQEHQ